jgi:hypothetical protein
MLAFAEFATAFAPSPSLIFKTVDPEGMEGEGRELTSILSSEYTTESGETQNEELVNVP